MHDWRKVIIKQLDTMQLAIEVLNNEALRIVLVVDNNAKLVGTITDGDIRRSLIKHLPMDTAVSNIMCKTPTVVTSGEGRDVIIDKMKKLDIYQIPILDNQKRIVGLEILTDLLLKKRHDNPVFLMAGGFGKRLRPLTNNTPKPLLQIGTKPILETILEQFISAGFHNIYISTHFKADMIREYFGDGSKWEVSINYIHEDKPLGTAGALGLLPKDMIDLPILMMNGDLLTKIDFQQLLEFHIKQGGDATMCTKEYDFQVPYGVIKAKDQIITSIVEKPVHKFFVNAGIYVLNPAILKTIDGVSYLDMPNLLEVKVKNGGQVNMFPLHEYWLDIGQVEQFEQAQKDNAFKLN